MMLKADKEAIVDRLGNIADELVAYEFWDEIRILRQLQVRMRRKHTANRRIGEKEQ
jgi:hypothetical protein